MILRIERAGRLARLVAWLPAVASLLAGCDARPSGTGGAGVGTTRPSVPASASAASLASASPSAAAPISASTGGSTSTPEAGSARALAPAAVYEFGATRFRLGELHDLGPAGPTTATPEGVVFVTLDERLLLAKRKGDTFEPLDEPPERFAKYGRGPSITKDHAYWIAPRGELVRVHRRTGEAERLANDARSGTRVSALTTGVGRDIALFVRDVGDDPRAFVWAEGGELVSLSADAATATSVELIPGAPHPRALVLEGRTGMSPVHFREVRVTKKQITLAPDEIVWVGPGSQPLTEIQSLARGRGEPVAFLATSRDVTHFGLAHFSLHDGPVEGDPAWRAYPNGLDPAPVATARLCEDDYVFFVVPSESRPRSPQELAVARVTSDGKLDAEEVLVRSRAFNEISVAPLPDGGLLSWTADRRTWGLVFHCPK